MPALIAFILRNWQAAIGVVVALSLIILLSIRTEQWKDAKGERDAALAREATLIASIAVQNAAVAAMEAEGVRARQRSEQALQAAQAANDRQRGAIDSLRAGSQRVRGPGEACEISPELRGAEGL